MFIVFLMLSMYIIDAELMPKGIKYLIANKETV